MPPEMAAMAAEIGVHKASIAIVPMFALATLAGAFIALGAAFATFVTTATHYADGPFMNAQRPILDPRM